MAISGHQVVVLGLCVVSVLWGSPVERAPQIAFNKRLLESTHRFISEWAAKHNSRVLVLVM